MLAILALSPHSQRILQLSWISDYDRFKEIEFGKKNENLNIRLGIHQNKTLRNCEDKD